MNSSSLYSLIIGIFIYNIGEGKLSPHVTTTHVHVVGDVPLGTLTSQGSLPHVWVVEIGPKGGSEESDEITSVEIFLNTPP
jgi:hypothetical protein